MLEVTGLCRCFGDISVINFSFSNRYSLLYILILNRMCGSAGIVMQVDRISATQHLKWGAVSASERWTSVARLNVTSRRLLAIAPITGGTHRYSCKSSAYWWALTRCCAMMSNRGASAAAVRVQFPVERRTAPTQLICSPPYATCRVRPLWNDRIQYRAQCSQILEQDQVVDAVERRRPVKQIE